MTSARESAEFAALLASQDRRLEREGIPMYLALVSETDRAVPAPPAAQVEAGRAIALSLDRFRAALGPTQRDDDHGVYISVMQAVSYCEFDAARLSSDPDVHAGRDQGDDHGLVRPHGSRDGEAAL